MEYKNTKLIVFLKTFTREELNEFEKFLIIPYFKQSRDPLPLFKVIKKFHPDFESDKFKEENIFRELYPDSDYSDSKSQNNFRSLSSYLLKAVEDFLFIADVSENNVLKKRIVLEKLLDRNLLKYFDQYSQSAYEELKNRENVSGYADIENILLSNIGSRYCSLTIDLPGYLESNIRCVEITSAYFWISLLRTAKTKYLAETYRKIETGNKSIEGFLEASDMEKILEIHKDTSRYVDLCFNYYAYMCLKNENDAGYYNNAKNIFFENKSAMSRADKIYYYSDLININSSTPEKRDLNYAEEFSILVSCIEDKAYKVTEEDFINPDFYRNVIVSANRMKEYDWADNFVNQHSGELMPEFRENMKNYSKALICFGRKEFEKSLEYISKVKYDLINFKSDLKIIMLKIFFELDMPEQSYSLSDTFKHYINSSDDLSKEIKKTFMNFIKYYFKILKLKTSYDKSETDYIRDQIKKETSLSQKIWLIEKLDEIKDLKK